MTLTVAAADVRPERPRATTSTTEYSQVVQAVHGRDLLERRYGYYS